MPLTFYRWWILMINSMWSSFHAPLTTLSIKETFLQDFLVITSRKSRWNVSAVLYGQWYYQHVPFWKIQILTYSGLLCGFGIFLGKKNNNLFSMITSPIIVIVNALECEVSFLPSIYSSSELIESLLRW